MTRLVVVGAAGFGREVLDVVDAIGLATGRPELHLVGVVDDSPSKVNLARLSRRGVAYQGTVAEWLDRDDGAQFVIGIGDPTVRRRLAELITGRGRQATILIHPSATFGFGVECAPGVVVCAGVQVSNEVRLGDHVHVNPNTTIGHDAVLSDYVSVNPGAIISGECHIGVGSLIGAGAVVLQQLRVGAGSIIGAGSCVTRDVPSATTVKGVPAR